MFPLYSIAILIVKNKNTFTIKLETNASKDITIDQNVILASILTESYNFKSSKTWL